MSNNTPEHLTDAECELWDNCFVTDKMGYDREGVMEELLRSLSASRARVEELEAELRRWQTYEVSPDREEDYP